MKRTQRGLWTIAFPSMLALFVAAGCSEPPRSQLGESCTKTADCVEGARCIKNTCIAPEAEDDEGKKEAAAEAEPAKPDLCGSAKKLAGFWGWTSAVVGAHSARAIGVNGYYHMTVTEADCKVKVALKKTGFGKRTWKTEKIQSGDAVFALEPIDGFDAQATGAINIVSPSGSSAAMSLTLIADNDLLWGFWSYEGTKWEEGGMWGAIKGKRDATDRLRFKTWSDQPCVTQCALGCEVPRRRKQNDMAGAPFEACVESCSEKPRMTPTLCKPRGTNLAPEDVGFKDKRYGMGWSDRCYKHIKAHRYAFAEAACQAGIKFATKKAKKDASGHPKALKSLGALNYNMGVIEQKRGAKKRALRYYVKALWWTEGENTGAMKKARSLGWEDPSDGDGCHCGEIPRCCYE